MELAHNELKIENESTKDKVKELKEEIKKLKEKNIVITTERNRFLMHRELLSKNIGGEKDRWDDIFKTDQKITNFHDVVSLENKLS